MSSQELIVKSEVDLKQQRESLNYVMHFLMELIKLRAICNHTFPFSRWKISGVDEVRALVRRYVSRPIDGGTFLDIDSSILIPYITLLYLLKFFHFISKKVLQAWLAVMMQAVLDLRAAYTRTAGLPAIKLQNLSKASLSVIVL